MPTKHPGLLGISRLNHEVPSIRPEILKVYADPGLAESLKQGPSAATRELRDVDMQHISMK
jgi:hypothetical protein